MEKSEYIVFLKKGIKFILLFIVLDLTLGSLAKEIFFSQETGKYARLTYSIEKDNSEILIMGSSHANRHFVPKIIEREFKKTCYNAGVQGQNILFQLALQEIILKRHKPNTIIMNIDKKWMYKSDGSYGMLADLYPYYWKYRSELHPILSLKSKYLDFKLLFKSYQTNSTLVHVVKYFILPQKDFNGYIPFNGRMKNIKPNKNKSDISKNTKEDDLYIDKNFVNAFKEFIGNAKNNDINLILVISPTLKIDSNIRNNQSTNIMYTIASKNNIPIIDYSNNIKFTNKYNLFNDPGHLNNKGAKKITKMLCDKIKEKHYLKL